MPFDNLPHTVPDSVENSGPLAYSIVTYAWVFLLSAWGGVVSFHAKVRKGIARYCNIPEFLGEVFTSAFVGVLTFYLCEYAHLNQLLTAAFIGVSGHMGARVIFLIEKKLQDRLEKVIGETFGEEDVNKE